MIPDEAVAAARRVIFPYVDDDHFDLAAITRTALEAAAPHLEKAAYERGWGAGFRHHKESMK